MFIFLNISSVGLGAALGGFGGGPGSVIGALKSSKSTIGAGGAAAGAGIVLLFGTGGAPGRALDFLACALNLAASEGIPRLVEAEGAGAEDEGGAGTEEA
mmetsp:Transcript_27729/g.41097  ORF Transcript_27729/g.41097 Transcript_27729/m.41097 type:complete len:100 (-) Transcript_27729:168-467(-)